MMANACTNIAGLVQRYVTSDSHQNCVRQTERAVWNPTQTLHITIVDPYDNEY